MLAGAFVVALDSFLPFGCLKRRVFCTIKKSLSLISQIDSNTLNFRNLNLLTKNYFLISDIAQWLENALAWQQGCEENGKREAMCKLKSSRRTGQRLIASHSEIIYFQSLPLSDHSFAIQSLLHNFYTFLINEAIFLSSHR